MEELHCPALPPKHPVRDRSWSKVSIQMLLNCGDVTVLDMCHSGTSRPVCLQRPSKGESFRCVTRNVERSCVVEIYVGVSLQRSANELLVSSLEGGAEAILLS